MKSIITGILALLFCVTLTAQQAVTEHDVAQWAKKMQRELSQMKQLMVEPSASTKDAFSKIEDGLRALRRAQEGRSEKSQIHVETRFIEIKQNQKLDGLDIRLEWRDGKPQPKAISEKTIEALKAKSDVLSAPSLLVIDGERASIEVRDEKEFSYLELDSDDRYVMKKTKINDGLRFRLTANIKPQGDKKVIHVKTDLEAKSIVGRTPIKIGAQTAGLPVLSTRSSKLNLVLPQNRWYLVPATKLETSSKPLLLIAIRTTVIN